MELVRALVEALAPELVQRLRLRPQLPRQLLHRLQLQRQPRRHLGVEPAQALDLETCRQPLAT